MAAINKESWIGGNVEVIEKYLKKEFENFAIAHQADRSLTHTFTVNDGKKRFTLLIGWPILADINFTQARIDRLLNENVAGKMRLHGANGYHWTPSK